VLHLGGGVDAHDVDAGGGGDGNGGDERDLGPPRGGLLRHGVALLARRPVADEADRVDRLARPPSGDDDAQPGEVVLVLGGEQPVGGGGDGGGVGEATRADVPSGQPAALGLDDVDAARAEDPQVVLDGGVLPHLGVHGRAHQHRRPGGEEHVGEQVVADPRRVDAEEARGGWRHEHQVGGLSEVGVGDGVGLVPQRGPRPLGRERVEGRAADEPQGALGEHGHHVGAGVDEPTAHVHRLVGGDAPRHAENDALALEHGAGVEPTYSADWEPSPSASSTSASGSGQ
jgi:hypothetical protein